MKRGLFTILSAISLLLFVAVCVLWVESYLRPYAIPWNAIAPGQAGWRIESMQGRLYLRRVSAPAPVSSTTRPPRGMPAVPENGYGLVSGRREQLGGLFATGEWAIYRNATVASYWELRTSYAGASLLTLPIAVPAVLRLRQLRKERRLRRRGLCPSCGYDLRATPDRCPECGAAPSKASA